MMPRRFSSQSGAALITVLMIVAAISVVAVGLNSAVTSATQRARLLDSQAQLRLYAVAAEAAAQQRLGAFMQDQNGRLSAEAPGLGEAQIVPIPEGEIAVIINDVTNCYNVNQLVTGGDGASHTADSDAIAEYVAVLEAASFDRVEAEALANALVDWMDANNVPGLNGAEDSYYSGEIPSYRTSGQRLANISELAAVRGYSRDVRVRLSDIVCARPIGAVDAIASLNLNTIKPEQAGQLVNALSGAIDVDEARRLIEARPLGGWPDIETFVLEPAIANIAPEARKLDRLGFVTTHIEVLTKVSYRQDMMIMSFHFETQAGQQVRLLSRRRVG